MAKNLVSDPIVALLAQIWVANFSFQKSSSISH